MNAMTKHFGNNLPLMIVEPGRSLVGDSGIIETEVVLISRKSYDEDVRWVYLDIGKFGGLAETMDEAIKYRLQVPGRQRAATTGRWCWPVRPAIRRIFSTRSTSISMPMSLKVGDKVRILPPAPTPRAMRR